MIRTAFLMFLATASPAAAQALDSVAIVTDQAEAVLTAAERAARGSAPDSTDWARIFESEGFRRLAQRDSTFGRPIAREEFQQFVTSPELRRRLPGLRRALAAWGRVDVCAAANDARGYLPAGTLIRARIYPVVKPRTNSFVWELDRDPAIFMYLDEAVSPAQFRNTLTHELHHVGNAAACAADPDEAAGPAAARGWMSGFGEGLAMLAATGDPALHPHTASPDSERVVWDRDVAGFEADLRTLERFFLDLAAGRAGDEAAVRERGMAFVSREEVPQGAFYTVGWSMAALVERELGREPLRRAACDPAELLHAYNRAAVQANARDGRGRPLWSAELLRQVPPR